MNLTAVWKIDSKEARVKWQEDLLGANAIIQYKMMAAQVAKVEWCQVATFWKYFEARVSVTS